MHYNNFLQTTTHYCCVVIADKAKVFEVLVFSVDFQYIQFFIKILPTVHTILVGKRNEQAGPRVKLIFL